MRIDFSNALKQAQAIANDIVTMLPNLVLAAVILLISYVMGRYIAKAIRALSHRAGQGANVGLLLGRMAVYAVSIFGFLVALSTVFPSFKARDLIQVLGIGGVAVGFAFKDIFQNFLAGVIILVSRPFRIGDIIAVKGFEGTVEDIQTRATMIRTYDNQRIVIPNSTVFTEEVKVITAYENRRTEVEFTIDYAGNLELAKETIRHVLGENENVDKTPAPDVLTMNFLGDGVQLRLRFWVTPEKANPLIVRDAVMTAVKVALDAKGIALAKAAPVAPAALIPPLPSGGEGPGVRGENLTNS